MKEEKPFSIKSAVSGFFLGAFIGSLFIYCYFNFIYSAEPGEGTLEALRIARIVSVIVITISSVAGLLWNGLKKTKLKFSLVASFAGTCIGSFAGFLVSVVLNSVLQYEYFRFIEIFINYGFMTAGFLILGYRHRGFSFMNDVHEELWRKGGE